MWNPQKAGGPFIGHNDRPGAARLPGPFLGVPFTWCLPKHRSRSEVAVSTRRHGGFAEWKPLRSLQAKPWTDLAGGVSRASLQGYRCGVGASHELAR